MMAKLLRLYLFSSLCSAAYSQESLIKVPLPYLHIYLFISCFFGPTLIVELESSVSLGIEINLNIIKIKN